jgi:uncharacterized protein (TIGR04255 family)
MLGQVRFPSVLRVDEREYVAQLQDALRGDYPDVSQEHQFGILLGPEGPVQAQPSRQWRFSASDGTWSVVLSAEHATLEASAPTYTNYQEFRDRYELVWALVLEHVRPSRRVQQGLRYINHLDRDLPPSGWGEIINSTLFGALATEVFGDEIDQGLSDLRVRRPNGTLAMKYGLVRAGPAQRLGYLLDFDYFAQDLTADMSSAVVLALFDEFHDVIYPLFRWCVTDEAADQFRAAD